MKWNIHHEDQVEEQRDFLLVKMKLKIKMRFFSTIK